MVHFLYRGGRTESSFGTIPSNGSILIINYTAESGLFGARFPVFDAKKELLLQQIIYLLLQ